MNSMKSIYRQKLPCMSFLANTFDIGIKQVRFHIVNFKFTDGCMQIINIWYNNCMKYAKRTVGVYYLQTFYSIKAIQHYLNLVSFRVTLSSSSSCISLRFLWWSINIRFVQERVEFIPKKFKKKLLISTQIHNSHHYFLCRFMDIFFCGFFSVKI